MDTSCQFNVLVSSVVLVKQCVLFKYQPACGINLANTNGGQFSYLTPLSNYMKLYISLKNITCKYPYLFLRYDKSNASKQNFFMTLYMYGKPFNSYNYMAGDILQRILIFYHLLLTVLPMQCTYSILIS